MTIKSAKNKLDKFINTKKNFKENNKKQNSRSKTSTFMTLLGFNNSNVFHYIDDLELYKGYLDDFTINLCTCDDSFISNHEANIFKIAMSKNFENDIFNIFVLTNGYQYYVYTLKNNNYDLTGKFDILNLSEEDYSLLLHCIYYGIEYLLFEDLRDDLEFFRDNVLDRMYEISSESIDTLSCDENINNKKLMVSILPDMLFEKSLSKLINYNWTQWNKKYIKPKKNYTCEMCGADMNNDKRLYHGHERYTVDHDNKVIIFDEVKHLCNRCHYTYHVCYVQVALSKEEQEKQLRHLQILNSDFYEYEEHCDLAIDSSRIRYDIRIIKDEVYYDLYSVPINKANEYVLSLSENKYTISDLLNFDLSDYSYDVKNLEYYEELEKGLIKAGIKIL